MPSTVSPWPYVVRKSFGPFTTTTTTTTSTTTKPPPSMHSASHKMNLRLIPDTVKLRHRSRFPHLDSVMDRLDKYAVNTQRPKLLKNDLDSWNNDDDDNTEDVFDDDDDLTMDDDYLLDAEHDNNLDEDTDYLEDDTADDEEDVEDEDDVDEATVNGKSYDSSSLSRLESQHRHQSHQHGVNVNAVSGYNSPLTAYKWEKFGTKQRVDDTRRNHLQQQKSVQTSQSSMDIAVYRHILRMNKANRCELPLPRVINVFREHSSPGITYIPHCTVLHRCSEDTGCCQNQNTQCAPKTQTQVYLDFYTSSSSRTGLRVVKLPFLNHTECACLPRDSSNPITTEDGSSTMNDPKSARLHSRSNELAVPASFKKCICPEEFVPSVLRQSEDRCICDCEDTNSDCIRMKKGKEYFSLKDRLCINNSKCGSPVCEYGSYLRDTGRCPKLQEKIDAFARVNVNRN